LILQTTEGAGFLSRKRFVAPPFTLPAPRLAESSITLGLFIGQIYVEEIPIRRNFTSLLNF
jgi:hypothetical protein